ncbi:BMQ_0737 family morphogenetic spore coat protein [Alkalicoccobacillus murimartini]|uniref:DUF3794 domain-containing protein n=1 Tax=Alkalicoccobacillus murimartini TaxID=171685 RepID=A0ABT9YK24_9BACI|nr:hypothetical protein [Alkalicoccobacillus murimartini]MDQ0207871.1 hypothetical protein [Alkalicoccobacillus murimartini]
MSLLKQSVVINVPKVFDWVTRQVDLPTISYREPELSILFPGAVGPSPGPGDLCSFLSSYPGYTTVARVLDESLYTSEVTNPLDRTQVEVTLPSGKEIVLEKVKILARGLLEVDIFDAAGALILTSNPIEFATIQTFYLCAPEDTIVDAFISSGQWDAEVVCDTAFSQLDISLTFCLDVHVFADVRLEIEAAYCNPRLEFPVADIICRQQSNQPAPSCPIFPEKRLGITSTSE